MSRKRYVGDIFAIIDQEEYIWAMKSSAYDQMIAKERGSLSADSEEVLKEPEKYSPHMMLIYKTTILASFVPDEIILNVNDYSTKTFDSCILSGDVSGFTELCETYNQIGSGGPTRLTDTLNNFIGAMAQEIISRGGDIIKFSGDAFLGLWKCSQNQNYTMRDYIQEAINCALIIQKNHNNFKTDVGVTLKVKLGISSGATLFSLIGDSMVSHYIEVGQPILDSKEILEICRAGDIIITEKAYAYVDSSAYVTETLLNGKYIRIFGVGPSWRQTQKFLTQQAQSKINEETDSETSMLSKISLFNRRHSSEFALRPLVYEAVNANENLYHNLKKFIIPPVMKRIELNEPLEYLTELRQVTVIMINIVPEAMQFEDLIKLVRAVFRIITIRIQKLSGCINKVSCFDKDLMCVIIFGLRGFKQVMECCNALKCAGLIHADICVLSKVKSISIGVSTGKTYCGVFGHSLRREYTVIGLTVNKAARLMVAYPGKVTCCNETFVNSKMKEIFFEQQQYIYLKGIKNPGPVYEFKYAYHDYSETMKGPIYPILGRQEELQVYLNLMKIFLSQCKSKIIINPKDVYIKMLMIEGEATIGKTRLIEEFLNITPANVSTEVISAAETHISNYAIKQIIFSGMGIAMNAAPNTRQDNLRICLSSYPKIHLLCALNDIFGVSFPSCEEYEKCSDYTKLHIKGELIQYLADSVFITPKVFFIDNMHLLDDAVSWQSIRDLLMASNIFIVGTIRSGKENRSKYCRWIYNSKRVHFLTLKKINEMYYAALACQMIQVEAISPDLENVIQKMSNGIAGWIKNFLICLQQADAIIIKPMTYEDIYEHGLVSPALYMMKRLNKSDMAMWKKIMEEKSDESVSSSLDPWIKYVDSCRDEFAEVKVREELKTIFKQGKKVEVCITAPDFERFTDQNEQSQEILIIRTFDSLLYTEQLVAKCGSVLGWQFSRNMLEYVVGDLCSDREKAEAIQKLFEHKIFGCSKGDFTEVGEYVIIRTEVSKNIENHPIECNCLALNIPDYCADLPKYASCGYIHFKSTSFLEATYDLLPEAQKIEFHMRAGRYLEKNTRRCRACGNGFFEEFTGKKEKLLKFANKRSFTVRKYSQEDDQSRHSDTASVLYSGSLAISLELGSTDYGYGGFDKACFQSLGVISPKTVYNLKERVSLTRTFSMYDFTNCECKLILNYMYGEVSRHFKVSGQYDLMLKAMLAYSKTCINLENIAESLTTLDVAEKHLKQRGISSDEPQWKLNLLRGNIFALRGKALLEMNQLEEASKYLFLALDNYEAPFPKSNFRRYIKSFRKNLRQKLALYIFPNTLTKNLRYYEEVYFNDVAECLQVMSHVFQKLRQFKQNELSAIWALECALKADYDFTVICQCFTDMIYIAQKNRNTFHCLTLEIHSLRYCHKKIFDINSDDVKYVAELYHVIRQLRLDRSELEKSVYIGYIALRLAISVNHYKLILESIPPLIYTLLLKSYLPEVCSLINELDYYTCDSDCNSVESGRLFFHIACLRFHIETGYTVIIYEDSEKFNYSENLQLAGVKNPSARIEFISLMWLWNCRNQRWECSSKWKKDIHCYVEKLLEGKKYAPYAVMYILEGYLLSFVHCIDSQNITLYKELRKTIDSLFQILKIKTCSLILPRLKHFLAYYEYIKGNEEKAFKLLEETLICAAKYENTLELLHTNHSKLAWTDQLPTEARHKWNTHSDCDHTLSYRMLDGYDDETISFTLPKPIYFV